MKSNYLLFITHTDGSIERLSFVTSQLQILKLFFALSFASPHSNITKCQLMVVNNGCAQIVNQFDVKTHIVDTVSMRWPNV